MIGRRVGHSPTLQSVDYHIKKHLFQYTPTLKHNFFKLTSLICFYLRIILNFYALGYVQNTQMQCLIFVIESFCDGIVHDKTSG